MWFSLNFFVNRAVKERIFRINSIIFLDIPDAQQYYETTYRAARKDYEVIDNSTCSPAGVPSVRYDVPQPQIPDGCCRADLETFGPETDAKTVLSPSIYTSYGLSFFDFFQPRQKDVIRNIFTNVGYKLDDETFEKLWNEGVEIDRTGLVCPETFKILIKKYKVEYIKDETKR